MTDPIGMIVEKPTGRCPICDWPLAATADQGCVMGNCAYRPEHGSEEWYRIQRNKVAAWAASPEGQASLAEVSKQAAEDIERLNKSRRLPWADLHTPVDL